MRTKLIIPWALYFAVFFTSQSALAVPNHVVNDFMDRLINKGQLSAKSLLINQMIKIPEIKENTPIDKFIVLPTPQYEDTKVVVAYFKGEVGGELIAFIWELVVKDDKISRIKVIHDGTNPFLEEAKLVKEYQLEFQKHVLVPSKLPFEVTGFDGYIDSDLLTLVYRSEPINGFLRIRVFPIKGNPERYKATDDEFYTLQGGIKVSYKTKSEIAYEIMFQKDGLQYDVAIGNKKYLRKSFEKKDLKQIVESMTRK